MEKNVQNVYSMLRFQRDNKILEEQKMNMKPLKQGLIQGLQHDRFILGIDGLSRSGKTTLVNRLKQWLQTEEYPAIIFHLDDYIEDRKKRYNTGNEEWYEYYTLQWDAEYLKQELFSKVHTVKELTLRVYDEQKDSHFLKKTSIPQNCLIIIEGVFLQRPEWKSHLDYIVYLDCPRETRFKREKEATRQKVDKFKNRYWKAEDHYLETIRPHEGAELVISQPKQPV
jgi:uridine kinase